MKQHLLPAKKVIYETTRDFEMVAEQLYVENTQEPGTLGVGMLRTTKSHSILGVGKGGLPPLD
jgi:hypothetical protein